MTSSQWEIVAAGGELTQEAIDAIARLLIKATEPDDQSDDAETSRGASAGSEQPRPDDGSSPARLVVTANPVSSREHFTRLATDWKEFFMTATMTNRIALPQTGGAR